MTGEISQPNNATRPPGEARPFGIRVSAAPEDPIMKLVDPGWHAEHWYTTRAERDAALRDMCTLHRYSRRTDPPSVVLTAIER